MSDGVAIAYLADVFIEPAHRGQGLGLWMVQSILSFPPLGTAKWSLHTRDAHALYQQLGFGPPSPRVMERAAVSE